jgi:allantoate deiminase
VEREAQSASGPARGLVATVGSLKVSPGADNVIAGHVRASLDVRHARDSVRHDAVIKLVDYARQIATRRGLAVQWEPRLDQPAVTMSSDLAEILAEAVRSTGHPVPQMTSGAGHDAMIMARRMPTAMLFLRSPGGISHHPDEAVVVEDVAAALQAGIGFLEGLDARHV